MPTTRKKVIKTVYENSDAEDNTDFSDSGSEAQISEHSESSEEDIKEEDSDDFEKKTTKKSNKNKKQTVRKTPTFAKCFINKIKNISQEGSDNEEDTDSVLFSVKDLTDADKLLPSVLNLSESDSSDDEEQPSTSKNFQKPSTSILGPTEDSDQETPTEYKDVLSNSIKDNSEEIARRTFEQLQQHADKIAETTTTLQSYKADNKKDTANLSDVKNLLALGEEVTKPVVSKKQKRIKKEKIDSDSEVDDWEEVKESKPIPRQGIQLVVDFPDAAYRKPKEVDVEMMMRRKINRVKKEYQVYMHKVHVLCWLGHGNFVSKVLNDQEIMAASLSLVPSKSCYPGERVDLKYVEQISTWFRDKLTLKQDKNEDKFKPKAPPLKTLIISQIKNKVVTTKKYMVFIFVSMLRALGLQCRVMFNFVTLPLKPPSTELCSLSTKNKSDTQVKSENPIKPSNKNRKTKAKCNTKISKSPVSQLDGNADDTYSDNDTLNILQVDGNNDNKTTKVASKSLKLQKNLKNDSEKEDDVSPPKRTRTSKSPIKLETNSVSDNSNKEINIKLKRTRSSTSNSKNSSETKVLPPKRPRTLKAQENVSVKTVKKGSNIKVSPNKSDESKDSDLSKPTTTSMKSPRTTRQSVKNKAKNKETTNSVDNSRIIPAIVVEEEGFNVSSKFFDSDIDTKVPKSKKLSLTRNRSKTETPKTTDSTKLQPEKKEMRTKARTKSAPGTSVKTSKYFTNSKAKPCGDNVEIKKIKSPPKKQQRKLNDKDNDELRVSHRDVGKSKAKPCDDVSSDLINIVKSRIKESKIGSNKKHNIVKGRENGESSEDSDYIQEKPIKPRSRNTDSDDDFKISKISSRTVERKIDRRVLSSDDEKKENKNKIDVWCEVFIEELEQWVTVDIIKGEVHCPSKVYSRATHPVTYVVGWDNNNYLKDLTQRYVPHWNTVTRKLRVDSLWWSKAIQPWLGPKTARDREEDESLDQLQLEAPLPKSIAEYKNHPLYALKRHLLKFEALYPPDAATLGFVRNEAVYSRACVHTCRSRDTWLKEAKVVRLGEKPYKIVKARPKWDKLSNKIITDQALEVFGPWQVQDYEPPTAENGIVPRNAYGNVELFKDCMLPKGTVHIKLPGLNKIARKLNIDCAPAMTGFDFNGGWTHPVFDGFVVCKEFEEIMTDAWVKDQEEQERKEREKIDARVFGNWKRLIKGLLIRERLKHKYGFADPVPSKNNKKKGPRLVVKKKM